MDDAARDDAIGDVLVVGAGPVGLTLAAELARHGIRCRIVDRLASPSPYCRAIGVTPRTLEVWDDMGIARQMIDAGLWLEGNRSIIHGGPSGDSRESFADLPYASLGIPQYETERVLTAHLQRFGIVIERGVELTALSQDESGVTVELKGADVETARFRYVVGCDGAHSAVRRALDISFEGDAFPMSFMLGDVHIAWDLPCGIAFRAVRPAKDAAPEIFIAIPLPEAGRYRVSMIAPPGLTPTGGTDHGIQSEARGPTLRDLQAVADDLVPERPLLSDLRWSSLFRISMRIAAHYRAGRAFIAGDAAHIHPPTGGQGMNTGIQDAYNLAWKLALVVQGAAPQGLLDSYEAERRPIGLEVVARTLAASVGYGREQGPPDRLANTQILVSYRNFGWVRDDGPTVGNLAAGDRVPDAQALRRLGIGFPLRLFDILRGPEHVLVAHLAGPDKARSAEELAAFAGEMPARIGAKLRIVAIADDVPDRFGIAVYRDSQGTFVEAVGPQGTCILVRPDGYIGWRGTSWRDGGLKAYFDMVFGP